MLARAPDLGLGREDILAKESGIHRRKMRSKEVVDCFVSNHKAGHEPGRDCHSDLLLLTQTLLSLPPLPNVKALPQAFYDL